MKKIYLIMFMMIALMSCTQEQSFEPERDSRGYTVSLNLRGGMRSPSTYAPVAASEEEYKVSELQALFFDADGSDRYMGRKRIDMSGIAMTPSSSPDSKYDAGFTVNIDMRGVLYDSNGSVIPVRDLNGKNVKFVFVANLPEKTVAELLRPYVESGNIYTKSISDIEKLIVSSEMIADNFVMLGLGAGREPVSGTLQKTAPASLPAVELERLSAKISVSVGEVSSHPLNEGLSITKVTLKNRIKSSFLFEKGGGSESYFESREDKEYVSGYEKLYTYENSKTGVTTLSVELSFRGRPLKTVEIPFKDKAIKRNHIYRVTLNRDASDGKDGGEDDVTVNPPVINFTIDVNDWEKDYIYYQDYKNQGNAIITDMVGYNADWTAKLEGNAIKHDKQGLNTANASSTISTHEAYNVRIRLSSISTQFGFRVKDKADWVTVKDVTTYSPVYGMLQEFNAEIKANETKEERTCVIEFYNMLNPGQICTATIKQAANAGGTTPPDPTPVPEPEPDPVIPPVATSRPKLSIEYVAEYNVSSTPGKFAENHNTDGSGYYTREEAETVCPEGYHLPTKEELLGIVNTDYVDFTLSRTDFGVAENNIQVGTHTANYNADYKSIGHYGKDEEDAENRGIVYAVRFKDTKNDMLSAWRYEYISGKGMKIKVIYLGPQKADMGIEEISNEKWWNTNSSSVIEKFFPTCIDMRIGIERSFYLSATVASSGEKWCFSFDVSGAILTSSSHISTKGSYVRPFLNPE